MTPGARRHVAEAAAVTLVSVQNWLSNRRTPAALYVPANVAVAGTLVALGRWGGATWADLGLGRARLPAALRAAAGIGGAMVGVVTVAVAAPATRAWFADERVVSLPSRTAAYHALFRIPVGTAFAEELAFRGVLLGLSLQHRSWGASVAWTSALFGLWHVLPTIDTLPHNPLGRAARDAGRQRRAVAASVGATAVAGAGLASLRWSTGSVVTPIVVHAAVNAAAFMGARIAHRDRCADGRSVDRYRARPPRARQAAKKAHARLPSTRSPSA